MIPPRAIGWRETGPKPNDASNEKRRPRPDRAKTGSGAELPLRWAGVTTQAALPQKDDLTARLSFLSEASSMTTGGNPQSASRSVRGLSASAITSVSASQE